MQIKVNAAKKDFTTQEAGAFGNNIERESQKPLPKLKNVYIYLQRIFALPAIQCKGYVFANMY